MKKITIFEFLAGMVGIFILGTCFVVGNIFKFLYNLRLQKITTIENKGISIKFKNRNNKTLFTLEKCSRYSVSISRSTLKFGYFGCKIYGDCHEFRVSGKVSQKLREFLTPSSFIYEKDMYRF